MIQELRAQRRARARPHSARRASGYSTTKLHTKDLAGSTSSYLRESVRSPQAVSRIRASASATSFADSRTKDQRMTSSKATTDCNGMKKEEKYGRRSPDTTFEATDSFQAQVLEELQKLKQAQLKDWEAIQQLQREKALAEHKARRLQEQFQSSKRSSDPVSRTTSYTRKESTSKHEELVIDEPCDDDELTDEDEDLEFDLDDDESLPPPHYEDAAPLQLSSPVESESELLSSPEPSSSPVKWVKRSSTTIESSSNNRVHRRLLTTPPPESASPVSKSRSSRVFFHDISNREDQVRGRARGESYQTPAQDRDRRGSSRQREKRLVQTWDSIEEPASPQSKGDSRRRTSKSRSPSTSFRAARAPRDSSREHEARRSSLFFEEKQRAKEEEVRIATEAAERLERAKRALPPKQLLERQELARQKKDAQIKLLEKEMNAELAKEKRIKAREVPISTYIITAPPSSAVPGVTGAEVSGDKVTFVTFSDLEAQRKERIRQRSQKLLESSELPPRMALALNGDSTDLTNGSLMPSTDPSSNAGTAEANGSRGMSVKLKKKLAAEAEERARKQRMKPKPVPDFDRLHGQWEKLIKTRKSATATSNNALCETREFFTARAAKLEELKAKKAERRRKQLEQEEQDRSTQREAQAKLLERTKASASKHALVSGDGPAGTSCKPTKAEELRVKKVLERLAQSQKQQEKEAIEAEVRQQRLKIAAKRVAAQVRVSEKARVESRSDYVSIRDIEQHAQQRAQEFKRSLKESIRQNKERILGAVSTKPSLMERFATDLKREEHKKNALEAVVKNVFKGNLGVMKGILTDDEHDLARDIIAADPSEDEDEIGGSKKAKAAKKKKKEEEEEEEEEATYSDS